MSSVTKMTDLKDKKDGDKSMGFITSLCFALLIWVLTPVMSFPVKISPEVTKQVTIGPMEITSMTLSRNLPPMEPYSKCLLLPGLFVKKVFKNIAICNFDLKIDGLTCNVSSIFDFAAYEKEADYSWLSDAYLEAVGKQRSFIEASSLLVVKGALLFFWRSAIFTSFLAQLVMTYSVMKAGIKPLPSLFYIGCILAFAVLSPKPRKKKAVNRQASQSAVKGTANATKANTKVAGKAGAKATAKANKSPANQTPKKSTDARKSNNKKK